LQRLVMAGAEDEYIDTLFKQSIMVGNLEKERKA
jgi:hypothetical protein